VTDRTVQTPPTAGAGAAAEFERLYRANVEAVTAYFARRSADPHVVADLTADTFVVVITSFGSFDRRKGTVRAWVFGIARHVYASYCQAYSHLTAVIGPRGELQPGLRKCLPPLVRGKADTGSPALAACSSRQRRCCRLFPRQFCITTMIMPITTVATRAMGHRFAV
jgi:DNA-directed RNA polymerase specialized sigma24 family protein